MNPSHHYDLFVTQKDGRRQVVVRRRIGSLVAEVAHAPVQPGPITLSIQAEPERYTLGVVDTVDGRQTIATGEARYLSKEVTGSMTGVFFALYTTGNGRLATSPSFFEWFDYRTTTPTGDQ
jgi:alpha-N-arabinofuranosidase